MNVGLLLHCFQIADVVRLSLTPTALHLNSQLGGLCHDSLQGIREIYVQIVDEQMGHESEIWAILAYSA